MRCSKRKCPEIRQSGSRVSAGPPLLRQRARATPESPRRTATKAPTRACPASTRTRIRRSRPWAGAWRPSEASAWPRSSIPTPPRWSGCAAPPASPALGRVRRQCNSSWLIGRVTYSTGTSSPWCQRGLPSDGHRARPRPRVRGSARSAVGELPPRVGCRRSGSQPRESPTPGRSAPGPSGHRGRYRWEWRPVPRPRRNGRMAAFPR